MSKTKLTQNIPMESEALEAIADGIKGISYALKYLGNGNSASEMGAIENLAACIESAGRDIADAIRDLATAVNDMNRE